MKILKKNPIKMAIATLSALMSVLSLNANTERPLPAQVSGARADYSQALSQPITKEAIVDEEEAKEKEEAQAESVADKVASDAEVAVEPAEPEATLYIADVVISGNELFTQEELKAGLEGKLAQDLTFSQIQSLALDVQKYYRENGYPIVRVIVPKGGLNGAVLTLEVLEGKLGKVNISGANRFSADKASRTVHSYIEEGKPFTIESLESALVMLNSLSGIKVASSLKAGDLSGTTDIDVKVEEENLIKGSIEFNNFGSENSGEYRVIPYLAVQNVTGIGDEFSAFAAIAIDEPESWSYQVNYTAPVTDFGTSFLVYFGQGNNSVGNEYEILDIAGDSLMWGTGFSHKIVWGAKTSLTFEAMFDWLDYTQEMLSESVIDDNVRKVRVGATLDDSDSTGRTIASLYIHQGVGDGLGAMCNGDVMASRYNSDNEFTKFVLSAVRLQSLGERFYAIFNFTGQYALNALVASEQIYLGGANSVRGQAYSSSVGDSGLVANAEVRYSVFKTTPSLQLAVFADYGLTYSEYPYVGSNEFEHMAGAGFGIRSQIIEGMDLRFDVAFPIGERYGDSYYFYGQVRYGF